MIVVELLGSDSLVAQRALASVALAIIVAVGVARGFGGLDLMERLALGAVLVLVTVLGASLLAHDAVHGVDLPPVPDRGAADVLRVLGGTVITVQGFETVRYLGDEYGRELRVQACRFSQLVSASIYVGFVAVATPVMGIGTDAGRDATLLDITERVIPFMSIPLVVAAVLSQFSAATADTQAADGNLRGLLPKLMRNPRAFIASGATATVLVWVVPTFPLIALASRAFALYYAIECAIAVRTSKDLPRRAGFGALGVVMLAIAVLAVPAG